MTGEGSIEAVLAGEARWAVVCSDSLHALRAGTWADLCRERLRAEEEGSTLAARRAGPAKLRAALREP